MECEMRNAKREMYLIIAFSFLLVSLFSGCAQKVSDPLERIYYTGVTYTDNVGSIVSDVDNDDHQDWQNTSDMTIVRVFPNPLDRQANTYLTIWFTGIQTVTDITIRFYKRPSFWQTEVHYTGSWAPGFNSISIPVANLDQLEDGWVYRMVITSDSGTTQGDVLIKN